MSVYTKLMTARITLQSMEIKKSGENKFAKYYYFELGDFLPAVQKIFYDLGLCGVVSYHEDRAILAIYDCENPTEVISFYSPMSSASLKGAHDIQNLGAVQTYLRRYLWVTAMEIVEHDALDAVLGKDGGSSPARGQSIAQGRQEATWGERRERRPVVIAPAASGAGSQPDPTVAPVTERLMNKLTDLGITKYGIKTILAITESQEFDQIPENKATTLMKAVTAVHVTMFNQGKNSKGAQVIPAPEVDKLSAKNSINELADAAEELFGDDEPIDETA